MQHMSNPYGWPRAKIEAESHARYQLIPAILTLVTVCNTSLKMILSLESAQSIVTTVNGCKVAEEQNFDFVFNITFYILHMYITYVDIFFELK